MSDLKNDNMGNDLNCDAVKNTDSNSTGSNSTGSNSTGSGKSGAQYVKMTETPVPKLLLTLSIPTIISMMVTNIYNIVDAAFVGTLGNSESAAASVVLSYMAILQSVAFMCGQGAGSIMSRLLGKQETDEAKKYTSTGFFFSFSLGLLIAVFTFIFMRPLLVLLGSTETIIPAAKSYITFIAIAAPFFTSSLTMNNLLRYEGKAKLGTVGMMTGAVLNIGGDALFIMVLKMGILGAGLSTALSQFVSFCILLSMFLRKRTVTRISFKYLAGDANTYWQIMATGFPSLLRQGLNSVATMLLNHRAGVCGGIYSDEAIAAMGNVSRISFFPMAVAIGIGQGFQPVSAFNLGAGKKDRVKTAFRVAFIGAEIALVLFSIPLFINAETFIGLMRNDSKVIEIGSYALRVMCICQLCVPLTMMVEMGFQSMGAKALAAFASSLRSGLIFIPVLLIMSNIWGLWGVQVAQPFSFVLSFIVCLYLLKVYMKKLDENR